MTTHTMIDILALLAESKDLPLERATRAFQIMMNGGATPAQMAAFVTALRLKGATVEEITAGATALRVKAKFISCPPGAIDPCGTGGDAKGTYNISTAVAFVLAAAGVPVAKHGNRAVSSSSGSADVLEFLGVNLNAEVDVLEKCMDTLNIAFLMAPKFHPAVRHIAPVRQELGFRTIFNLLGPLINPAKPDFQLMGVYDKRWVEPCAHVLKELGTKAAWVVHGKEGLDELSITGESTVAALKEGEVTTFTITPEDAGLERATLEEIKGGDVETNAKALQHALSGMDSGYRRAVLLNAAAGLLIAGRVCDLKEGVARAADAIDSSAAYNIMMKLAELSHSKA
ncbi:MAG: anthranilate phosphoribosyltransferase [Alphaproteobacteria bacterium]